MVRRLPSQPPVLPGFAHLHVLGAGGFADVFLYEQNLPRRQVAVKVLLNEVLNDQVRRMFQAEANLMAQLSAHPSILTVYQASVSADGRPYLVMELCSSSLSDRYRSERLALSDVLTIAVKIGSAVETAHRQGVLHRDIKPSNILTTAYGHPVLSDFGIAASLGESDPSELVGMSIPWSAPEVLRGDTSGTVESEVWSLAATLYSLLAGRSPFEIPGSTNTASELIARIERAKVPPIGRDDVPPRLEATLRKALSRQPAQRHRSVLEFVEECRRAQAELGLPLTAIDVAVDDWALATVADLEHRTRVQSVDAITKGSGRAATRTVSRATNYLAWGLIVASAVVLGLGGLAAFALVRANSTAIPTVSVIRSTMTGASVEFTWDDPGLASGDVYIVSAGGSEKSTQTSRSFVAQESDGQPVCITVTVDRAGKNGAPSAQKCAVQASR